MIIDKLDKWKEKIEKVNGSGRKGEEERGERGVQLSHYFGAVVRLVFSGGISCN